jgi:transcriptional regulator with XRE-family HTH domain
MPSKSRRVPAKLADKLLAIREQMGLSQNEMVKRLNAETEINRGKISEYERGQRIPPLHILLAYARAAGTTMEVLVDDELNFRA